MAGVVLGSILAGKYRVKRVIGAGGMGAVYEGQHIEIGKRVAIKVINPEQAGSDEMAARFRREARAASAVESDHIVQVFDVGQDPEAGLYMVMEFLTGEDLATRLLREPRLDLDVAMTIGRQVARALAKAHDAGVVHRDLKPANLFLCARDDGAVHVKILDFGISKLMQEEQRSVPPGSEGKSKKGLTTAGALIGTPQYMSPEQAQGLSVDLRTDVWSLGAVLYEALAGTGAYPEMSTYQQTIIQIVTQPPKPLAEIAPWVPSPIAAAIHATLVHDVKQRTADCAIFAKQLADAAGMPRLLATPQQFVIQPESGGTLSARESLSSTKLAPGAATHAGVVVSPAPSDRNRAVARTGGQETLAVPGVSRGSRLVPILAVAGLVGAGMIAASIYITRHSDHGAASSGSGTPVVGIVAQPPPLDSAIPLVIVPPPVVAVPSASEAPRPPPPIVRGGARPVASAVRVTVVDPKTDPKLPGAAGSAKPPHPGQYGATGVEKDY